MELVRLKRESSAPAIAAAGLTERLWVAEKELEHALSALVYDLGPNLVSVAELRQVVESKLSSRARRKSTTRRTLVAAEREALTRLRTGKSSVRRRLAKIGLSGTEVARLLAKHLKQYS